MDANENEEDDNFLENVPELLAAKLLFAEKPQVNKADIVLELRKFYREVHTPDEEGLLLFVFPEIDVPMGDASIPAQCNMFVPETGNGHIELPPEAFEQNWQWPEAAETVSACGYEVLLSDFMTRGLPYKARAELFAHFLTGVVRALKPQAIYCVTAQKLLPPDELVPANEDDDTVPLNALANVRLYTVSNGESGELLMDTVGLNSLGLPDLEIRFSGLSENDVAQQLWNCAYYLYEEGDVIDDDNTISGVTADDKWLCKRQLSLTDPQRVVIHLVPQQQ